MLKHLSITNYAIIENVELEINNGFTVITGETGAGKSILLGALSLILGKRADTSVLNNKQKKCIVEGEFIFNEKDYFNFFKQNDLDYEEVNIIRREINASGKSRAFINDTPVGLNILKELTTQLVDIHSQHQTLQIKGNKFQLNVIDAFANIGNKVEVYHKRYIEYISNKRKLSKLNDVANGAKADQDYITFQVQEIEDLNLKPNEKENIESELELINNAEEIKSVLENSSDALVKSDQNLLLALKNISNLFSKIYTCSNEYKSIYERLNSLVIELEDIALEIGNNNNNLNFNHENLAFLNDRLSKIFSVEQKHNLSSSEEILLLLESLKKQLSDSNSYEEQIVELTNLVSVQREELVKLAKELSEKRKENIIGLSSKIVNSLNLLGMPDASFEVKHLVFDELNEYGIDKIDFLFTSNKGVDTKELSKVASGGELSRLMLAIKSIIVSNKSIATIVFDEIDTGVSGDIADKMASIMKQMSKNVQILAITHLPQVAAKGEDHYKIYKENKEGKTLTSLSKLNKMDRVEELAKMLSGKELSSAARENAKILLDV